MTKMMTISLALFASLSAAACGVSSPNDPTPLPPASAAPAPAASAPAPAPAPQPAPAPAPSPEPAPLPQPHITVQPGASPNTLLFLIDVPAGDLEFVVWNFGDGHTQTAFAQMIQHSIDEPQRSFTVTAEVHYQSGRIASVSISFQV